MIGVGTLKYDPAKKFGKWWLMMEVSAPIVLDAQAELLRTKGVRFKVKTYNRQVAVIVGETPAYPTRWKMYEGCQVSFEYGEVFQKVEHYWWTAVFSGDLVRVREELGLCRLPLDGFYMNLGLPRRR